MRTPSRYAAKDGTTSWKVRYRRAGRQSSLSFYGPTGKAEADKFCKMVDSVGVERAIAFLGETANASPTDLTLDQWAERYIASLTGITDGTATRTPHLPASLARRARPPTAAAG